MKKILLILLCLPMIGFGQPIVNIPDANFKAYLVGNTDINTNGDAEIQVSEAATFNDTIDCDNMSIKNLKAGVKIAKKYYTTEASGNINLKTVKKVAKTGVDRISVGSITHSNTAIDFKLEIQEINLDKSGLK